MRTTADDGWIAFLNREGEELAKLEPTLPRGVLRATLRDRLGEAYGFPMRTFVRALVTGERDAGPPESAAGAQAVSLTRRSMRLLELWPAGLDRRAAALSGPLLVPCERKLGPGSVLTAALVLEDPRRVDVRGPGLFARLVDCSVEVAVEP